jgi:hypothetical protein
MRVSRRIFILSGLISVSGLFYWKKQTIMADNIEPIATDIESFFASFESVIPAESIFNISNQKSLFEKELLSMLSSIGVVKTIAILTQNVKDEFQEGKVKLMNNWIVSETEFSIFALRNKYV